MVRKLGQIIALRDNTWLIRIPLGCDPKSFLLPDPDLFRVRLSTATGQLGRKSSWHVFANVSSASGCIISVDLRYEGEQVTPAQ